MKESIYQQRIAMFSAQRLRHIWPVLPSFCSATTGELAASDTPLRFRAHCMFATMIHMGCPDILWNALLDMLHQHSADCLQGGVPGENAAVSSIPARPRALHTLHISGCGSSRSCKACAEHRQASDGVCLCARLSALAAPEEASPGRAAGVPSSLCDTVAPFLASLDDTTAFTSFHRGICAAQALHVAEGCSRG